VPPLRERPEDIRLLAHHFAMGYAARMGRRYTSISEGFMEGLAQHTWPGNIRELQNVVERSAILSTGAVLSGKLPEPAPRNISSGIVQTGSLPEPIPTVSSKSNALAEAQRALILQVLEQAEGVVGGRNGAAARLGMRRTTLIYKMQRLGINHRQNSVLRMPGVGEKRNLKLGESLSTLRKRKEGLAGLVHLPG
jgi:transcriptional regulator with GAF, ATPase, and Fis domain